MRWYKPSYTNNLQQLLRPLVVSLALCFFGADVLWAATGAHGDGGHGIGWPFVAKVLNFSVIAVALAWLAKKHLPGFLKNRSASVSEALARAEARESEAHQLLREYDKKLGDLGQLMESMLNQAREAAETERNRLIAQAELEAKEIIESANRSAKNLEARLQSELRRRTLQSALVIAQQKVQEQLQSNDGQKLQAAYVEQFLTEVGNHERR